MAFKVRDLMIDVAPVAIQGMQAQPYLCPTYTYCPNLTYNCPNRTYICPNYSFITCLARTYVPCPGGSYWDPIIMYTDPIINDPGLAVQRAAVQVQAMGQPEMVSSPQSLAELKAQLRQSLAQVEAQEQAMAASMKPRTVEEADMLERKLSEALDELRQHKEELRRRSST